MSDELLPRTFVAQALTRHGFAPFGEAFMVTDESAQAINAGSAQRFDGLGTPDLTALGGAACLALFRTDGAIHVAPWTLRVLERHVLGSQTFVPLGSGIC